MKKIIIAFILAISVLSASSALAWNAPRINCAWLPGCQSEEKMLPPPENGDNPDGGENEKDDEKIWELWESIEIKDDNNPIIKTVAKITSTFLGYVSVIAVVCLMLSWAYYLFSGGEEEKTTKAKKWIIYSLVWIIVSLLAYRIVGIIDNTTVDIPSSEATPSDTPADSSWST